MNPALPKKSLRKSGVNNMIKNKIIKLFYLIVAYSVLAQFVFAVVQKKVIAVAVFENVTRNKEYDWIGTGFAEDVTVKLVNIESLIVVERSQLLEIIKEQKLYLSGLVDENTAVKVGKLIAAQYMIIGSFQEAGGNLKVTARVVSVETAEVEKSAVVEGRFNALFELQQKLTLEIAKIIGSPASENEKNAIAESSAKNLSAYEWFAKGKMYHYEKFLPDEAIKCYKKAIKIDRKYADAHLELGNVLENRSFYGKAFESYKNALALYETAKDKRNIWRIFQNIGVIYYYRGNYRKALEYYGKAIAVSEQLAMHQNGTGFANRQGIARVYSNIGLIYCNCGDYNKALEYYKKALEINEKYENKKAAAETYNYIGSVYDSLGDYEKAFEYCSKAFGISRELNDRRGMAAAYNLFGNFYFARQNSDQAIEYFKKALEINRELAVVPGIIDCYINIGAVYYSIKCFDSSLEYFEKALEMSSRSGNRMNIARAYNNIGLVRFSLYEYNEALKCFNESLVIKLELGDSSGAGTVMYNISLVYEYKRDYNNAIKYTEDAVRIFEKTKYYMLEEAGNRLKKLREKYKSGSLQAAVY